MENTRSCGAAGGAGTCNSGEAFGLCGQFTGKGQQPPMVLWCFARFARLLKSLLRQINPPFSPLPGEPASTPVRGSRGPTITSRAAASKIFRNAGKHCMDHGRSGWFIWCGDGMGSDQGGGQAARGNK
eukprot:gene16458-biopygen12807